MSKRYDIMSFGETAHFLGISERILLEMCRDGRVPFAWLGKRRMFSREALLALFKETHPERKRFMYDDDEY